MFSAGKRVPPPVVLLGRPLDNSTDPFLVHCPVEVLDTIRARAEEYRDTEIFGRLLGRVYRTESGLLRTVIQAVTIAEAYVESSRTFVNVSGIELSRMEAAFEEANGSKGFLNVGWFHTHPGHGIFMSGTDRSNHAMYEQPWQVALVVDPINREFGFFQGADCKPLRGSILCPILDHETATCQR